MDPRTGSLNAHQTPASLKFMQWECKGKGTYTTASGKPYEFVKLEIRVKVGGEETTLKLCADLVDKSTQNVILGLGAALKAAEKRFKTAEQLQKAFRGEDGEPPLHITFGSTVETVSSETGEERMTTHLFQSRPENKSLEALFKDKKNSKITMNQNEISHLKNIAKAFDTQLGGMQEVSSDESRRVFLEGMDTSVRVRMQEVRADLPGDVAEADRRIMAAGNAEFPEA